MAMKTDDMKFEILDDGTISVVTDQVSGTNHHSADELMKELKSCMGGVATTKKRNRLHVHSDMRGALNSHTHDGHVHQH